MPTLQRSSRTWVWILSGLAWMVIGILGAQSRGGTVFPVIWLAVVGIVSAWLCLLLLMLLSRVLLKRDGPMDNTSVAIVLVLGVVLATLITELWRQYQPGPYSTNVYELYSGSITIGAANVWLGLISFLGWRKNGGL